VSRFHEELYRKKGPSHDDLVIRCVSRTGINKILLDLGMPDKHPDFQWDYETEVVCVNRGYKTEFIIGYADILLIGHEPGIIPTSSRYWYQRVSVVIEVKPKLDDIGSTIRQLKTYERCLRGSCAEFHKVIVTHSQVRDDIKEYLEHEGVLLVVFEEG
jgi:hypothetical protein